MSATPLTDRYPHLVGQPQVQQEHPCPHCGEAILRQLVPERVLGVYTAEGWWHCPSCSRTCTTDQLKPQTSSQEIDQCRREDERRGQPGGSSNKCVKRKKPFSRKGSNPLQDQGGGRKDKTIVIPTGEKFTNASISMTNDEQALARAYATQLGVPISQVWRWGLGLLKHCGMCPDCHQPSPGETCLLCGLEVERASSNGGNEA